MGCNARKKKGQHSGTSLVITPQRKELRLDVRIVYLCYNMPFCRTPVTLLSDEYLNKVSRVTRGKVNIQFRIFFLIV
jgi:hypothetical protein